MGLNHPYKTYQNQSVTTASPGELTLMLYEGCLKFIRTAKIGISKNDYEQKNVNLVNAQNIIRELMNTLDKSVEISATMMRMYEYIYRRLIEANVKNDIGIVEEVEGYVAEFRDTWKEILRIDRKNRFGEGGRA